MNTAAESRPLRFTGANAREALARAREALGPDALVLANRRTACGVEVLAIAPQAIERLAQGEPDATAQATAALAELRALAARIAVQLDRLAWAEEARRRPLAARLAGWLVQAGFGEALVRALLARLPDDYGEERARSWVAAALARNLRVVAEGEDPVGRGGVYALVGPTGVGKTTTVAKLAARQVVRHGAASLGLVTCDGYRIGAYEQLRAYARILGVPVYAAHDEAELAHALAALEGRRLVLIDTVGVGQRDAELGERLAPLAGAPVARLLVLSASADAAALEESVNAFGGSRCSGAVLTKVDEAARLGVALDVLLRHRLALVAVANGQRVPEDLHPAHAGWLVDRALRGAPAGAPACAAEPALEGLA